MRDNIKDIVFFGRTAEWELVATGTNSDPLTVGKRIKADSRHILGKFTEVARKINNDPMLSDIGKKDGIEKAARSGLESIAKLRGDANTLADALSNATARARERSDQDQLTSAILSAEIRRLLFEQTAGDPLQVSIAYRDALEAGDFDTLDAIETAPKVWPGTPTNIDELKAARLEVANPKLGKEVAHLTEATKDIEHILNNVEDVLKNETGLDDPLQVAAAS